MEIRSYRAVFRLERRIYRIDRLRLNPAGVPVRGVAYFIVLALAAALLSALPGVGLLLRAAPWYLREGVLPAGAAALLTVVSIDGRPFHLAAGALARYVLRTRETVGGCRPAAPLRCWRPDALLMLPDGSQAGIRRLRYTGPGAVRVSAAHCRIEWYGGMFARLLRRPALTLRALPGERLSRPQLIELAPGARMEVR